MKILGDEGLGCGILTRGFGWMRCHGNKRLEGGRFSGRIGLFLMGVDKRANCIISYGFFLGLAMSDVYDEWI